MTDPKPDDFRRDDLCFACGQRNAHGLRLQPDARDGEAVVRWTPPLHYQGYAGVLHGGIISTIMDEAMAHAAISLVHGAATAELSMQFLKPVMTGRELEIRASVRERRRRILYVGAELIQDGEVRARGEGKFLIVTPMRTQGFGETRPVASNETAEGEQANRRVEVIIDPKAELRRQAEEKAKDQGQG